MPFTCVHVYVVNRIQRARRLSLIRTYVLTRDKLAQRVYHINMHYTGIGKDSLPLLKPASPTHVTGYGWPTEQHDALSQKGELSMILAKWTSHGQLLLSCLSSIKSNTILQDQ